MPVLAVFAERFAVVGGDDDDRAVEQPLRLELLQDPRDLRILKGNRVEIRIGVPARMGVRHAIGPVSIVQVDPREERSLARVSLDP